MPTNNQLLLVFFLVAWSFLNKLLVPQSLYQYATGAPLQRIQSIEEFFPEIQRNLTAVTWDHAVNSQELLNKSLSTDVMMLEADIVLGTLENSGSEIIPIMAHPPSKTSDLSLKMFLEAVIGFNSRTVVKSKKGVKLDFKSTEAFEMSEPIIRELQEQLDFPVWLNADILRGPVKAKAAVDPKSFIQISHSFDGALLSLGWKTRYGNGIKKASYSQSNVEEMVSAIEENMIEGKPAPPITFPVRAGIAAQSIPQLLSILNRVERSTLTLWGSEGDPVDVELLRKLIQRATVGKVYVDVPNSLLDQLRLGELKNSK